MDPNGLFMKYFVLNPNKRTIYGEASRRAIMAYADTIERENPKLAKELKHWVRELSMIHQTP